MKPEHRQNDNLISPHAIGLHRNWLESFPVNWCLAFPETRKMRNSCRIFRASGRRFKVWIICARVTRSLPIAKPENSFTRFVSDELNEYCTE